MLGLVPVDSGIVFDSAIPIRPSYQFLASEIRRGVLFNPTSHPPATRNKSMMWWSVLIPRFLKRRGERSEVRENEPVPHLLLGTRGERLASERLEQLGYRLVAANFVLPVGRNLRGAVISTEIDLIAYDERTLCFVEVKTRASDWFAQPEANVDLRKQRQVARAARAYRRMFGLTGEPYRYDVVSVVIPQEGPKGVASRPRVDVLRNFWTDDKFRKRRWSDHEYDS